MLLSACLSRLCRACLFGYGCTLHVLPCLTCLLVFVLCLLCVLACLDYGVVLPLSNRFTVGFACRWMPSESTSLVARPWCCHCAIAPIRRNQRSSLERIVLSDITKIGARSRLVSQKREGVESVTRLRRSRHSAGSRRASKDSAAVVGCVKRASRVGGQSKRWQAASVSILLGEAETLEYSLSARRH